MNILISFPARRTRIGPRKFRWLATAEDRDGCEGAHGAPYFMLSPWAAAAGRVMVGHFRDPTGTVERTLAVNREPERVDSVPDARPKIIVDHKNRIVLAYAVFPGRPL
jgi:hypothetical protein